MTVLLETPLAAWHAAAGAKMAPFAGWNMPIQYPTGIIAEHLHTRDQAGLFDICHMGEFIIDGKNAAEALGRAVSNNIATLKPGRCRYGFLLNEQGGVLDDLIVYRLKEDRFMLVVNAGCRVSDFEALSGRIGASALFEDISDGTAKIDLQGPESIAVLESVIPGPWRRLPYFGLTEVQWEGASLLISRTGYTGELGVELYYPWDKIEKLWTLLLADARVRPVGLGARDTLRLEVGLPLYGQDLDEHHTPAEAGYTGMLTSQTPYVGKEHAHTIREKLLGLNIPGRRSARHGDIVCLPGGREVGVVTSGSFSPSCGNAIAFAYIKAEDVGETEYLIRAAKTELPATATSIPFYKKGTARNTLV